ncbi:MAG TPA: sulfatase-like hydrolase/transferase [Planctomycetota bacterium]|nr:sulfatase-like hydrolase/transferase [Planctomycetota bacterium]
MRAAVLLGVVAILPACGGGGGSGGPGASDERPNVVLILADDLGREGLSCYGGRSVSTPNLDRLASEGLRFRTCLATPLCSPTRVTLLTGRYPFRTGWTDLINARTADEDFLDFSKERTIAHALRDAGYATFCAGKWQLCRFEEHPHHVNEAGFDDYLCWSWTLGGVRTDRYWDPVFWKDGAKHGPLTGKYGPDLEADAVLDFISANASRPFFVFYPLTLVHDPWESTPDQAVRSTTASNFDEMVAYMDKLVGRVVAHLDALDLRRKTLLVFTGDNGTDARLSITVEGGTVVAGGKGSMTDRGTRVPLIVSRPGSVPEGVVAENLVDLSDLFPTIAEITGTPLPGGVTIDGRSFAARLAGGPAPREWAFAQLRNQRLVRDARWRLHSDGRLFDLAGDPWLDPAPTYPGGDGPDGATARARLQPILDTLR